MAVFNYLQVYEGAPHLTINLGNNNSKYNYGGTTKYLDLDWYTPYKPTVDKVIIAIAYLMFFFNMYRNLPSIISGSSAVIHKVGGGK